MEEKIKLEIKKAAPEQTNVWEGTLKMNGQYIFIAMDVKLGILNSNKVND